MEGPSFAIASVGRHRRRYRNYISIPNTWSTKNFVRVDCLIFIHDITKTLDISVYIAYNVYMSRIQYTIRNIPAPVDKVIKKRAKQSGKSFNQTVVDILAMQTFGSTDLHIEESFDWLYNNNTLDDSFDEAIKDISKIDKKIW